MTTARAVLGRVTGRIRQASAAAPLRVKLVAALLVLVTLALIATGTAGSYALRGYLIDKVDAQLADRAARYADHPLSSCVIPDSPAQVSGFFMQLTGNVNCRNQLLAGDQTVPELPTMDDATIERLSLRPFTAAASGAGHAWRVLVVPAEDRAGNPAGSMAIGVSLEGVDETVGQLIAIELIVGAVVLFVLGALGYTAIRSSLRPLVEVEATAAAIASGDLARRIPRWPARTEVGRLAGALNGMLAQIETAFTEREVAAAQARASEARMRRFIADASHELRTPLTSVRGFAELLRQQIGWDAKAGGGMSVRDAKAGGGMSVRDAKAGGGTPAGDEEPASYVLVATDRIERAATRMGLLIEDLLLLARLDQQRPLEARPVDLLALVTDAVGEARMADPDHPVTAVVRTGGAAGPPVVRGDLAKLRQVVGNLLDNAFQHTPPGTAVTVSVGAEAGAAVLEVADEGPGLHPEDAARIFERFYRVDAARNRANGGTGLGLSIVDSIVTAHGGRVTVQSAPGEGACFRVTLPLLDPEPVVDGARPGAGSPATDRAGS